jgi:hypothetical protein
MSKSIKNSQVKKKVHKNSLSKKTVELFEKVEINSKKLK